jgi:hypothetical protein
MSNWLDTAKDAWWIALVVPVKLAWRQLWRMLIFATRPDLSERVNQAYEWEHKRRIEAERENERLRAALTGLIDSSYDEPVGHSSKEPTNDDEVLRHGS